MRQAKIRCTNGWSTGRECAASNLDYKGMALSTLFYCDGGENVFDNDLQGLNGNECPDASACDKQGCIGGPINTRSGNYGYAVTDLSIPTAGAPLRLERNYNSSNVISYTGTLTDPLGPGWTHSYAMRLFPNPVSGTFFTATVTDTVLARSTLTYRPYVTVRLPGGSWLRLVDDGDGTYTPYPGAQTTLSTTTEGGVVTTYTLTSADQTVRVFDADGLLKKIRDRRGNETRLDYDVTGRLKQVLGPIVGPTAEPRYLEFSYTGGWLTKVEDHAGRSVEYVYEGDHLTVVTDTRGSAWTYAYTSIPLTTSESITLLHEVNDPAGSLVERTDYVTATVDGKTIYRVDFQENGAGATLEIDYGEHTTTITEAERVRVHSYDFFGTLVEEVSVADDVEYGQDYGYNWDFRRERSTDALGRLTQMEWNSCCGQLSSITDAQGYTTTMAYDEQNNMTAYTDAAGHSTYYEYEDNLLTTITDTKGGTVVNTYTDGLLTRVVDHGITTTYDYDGFGQRTAVTDTLGNVTRYEYDDVGRLITTTAPNGLMTVNEYDDGDNLIQVTRNYTTTTDAPNHLGIYNLITEYKYDEVGNRTHVTDTQNHVTRSWYDEARRLITTTSNYSPTITGHGPGNDWNITTTYGYDDLGHLITTTVLPGTPLEQISINEYDALSNLVRVTRNYLPPSVPPMGGRKGGATTWSPSTSTTRWATRPTSPTRWAASPAPGMTISTG